MPRKEPPFTEVLLNVGIVPLARSYQDLTLQVRSFVDKETSTKEFKSKPIKHSQLNNK